jgi:hypothetical protein
MQAASRRRAGLRCRTRSGRERRGDRWEIDVGLVHSSISTTPGGPAGWRGQGFQADVGVDVVGFGVGAILGVLQAAQGVEAVEQILGLAGALDRHGNHLAEAELFGNGAGQTGLAAAGLALHQQRAAQVDGQVDDLGGLGRGDVAGALLAGVGGVGMGHGRFPCGQSAQKPLRARRL